MSTRSGVASTSGSGSASGEASASIAGSAARGDGAEGSGIRLADHLVELGPTRDDEAHVLAERLADVPVEDVVRRVGDRDEREAFFEADRQRAEEPRLILAQKPRRLGIDRLACAG